MASAADDTLVNYDRAAKMLEEDTVPYHMIWIVAIMVLIWYLTKNLVTSRRYKRAMAQPLLADDSLVDHRIDAAKREASHGFVLCPACGFENFTRASQCALCGVLCFDHGAEHVPLAPKLQDLSPQQLRARRRKEWQRKIDVEGRSFWYRNAIDGEQRSTPAFVVQFAVKEDLTTTPVGPSLRGSTACSSGDHNDDQDPQDAIVDANGAILRLVETPEADAAQFALGDRVQFDSDAMQLSARDFPSKYSHFVVHTAVLLHANASHRIKLKVKRDFVLEQSLDQLSCVTTEHVKLAMRIRFEGEAGVDAGGLHREWFMVLNEMLAREDVGLFTCTNRGDQTYYINGNSAVDNGPDHLVYFYGAGRLIGRALLEGAVLGFHLSAPLLKIILGTPVSLDDLAFYDPEMHKNLTWLLENEDVESLGLDFTVTEKFADGSSQVVDLIPHGRDVSVTDANKQLYVTRRFQYTLFERVRPQLFVFLRGIYDVIPLQLLVPFDYEELDYLLCGTSEIDVGDWEANTRISLNLEDNPRVVRWFWELVREMDGQQRRRLLHFSTGSARVPLVGFKGLTSYDGRLCAFTLKGVAYETDQYIRSHACFNMLDLPIFRTKDAMRAALLGLLDGDIYGFTTA